MLRYRYPNESWKVIQEADNYSLDQLKGQDCSKTYAVTHHVRNVGCYYGSVREDYVATHNITGKILDTKNTRY